MSKKTSEQDLESTGVDHEDQVAKSIQSRENSILKSKKFKGLPPGSPVAKTRRSQCRKLGSISGWGTISHTQQLRPSTTK